MGHAIDFIVVDNRNEIMEAAERFAFLNTDREENPDGHYHGNMTIHDKPICESVEMAEDMISHWDTGWYSDHAVQFKDRSVFKPTKKMEELLGKCDKILADRDEYIKQHSVKNRQSEFIGCKWCNSKLARKYLRGEKCPVCGEELRAPYIIERIKKYDRDFEATCDKINELKKKHYGKCPVKWLVKVEVHC